MKRIHLLRVEGDATRFEALIAAIRRDGGRVGWLDLALSDPLPPSLTGPASLDLLRAVAVGPGLAIAVKPMRGGPVLRDLLREHFRGCRLVLVAGGADSTSLAADAPLLSPEGEGWSVTAPGGTRSCSTEQLVAQLRKPRPAWASGQSES